MTDHAPSPAPPPSWADQTRLLLDLALGDLAAGGDVLPTMVAFRGDEALFLATIRPFAPGDHEDAVLEVGALAAALRADRLLLSLAGRAWSLHDPIPPVLPDGPDLRQRVVVLHRVDATTDDPACLTTVVPIEVADDGQVVTGPALTDIDGEGTVPRTLLVAATMSHGRWRRDELAVQVVRCEQLGHRIAWSTGAREVVELARLEWLCSDATATARSGWPG